MSSPKPSKKQSLLKKKIISTAWKGDCFIPSSEFIDMKTRAHAHSVRTHTQSTKYLRKRNGITSCWDGPSYLIFHMDSHLLIQMSNHDSDADVTRRGCSWGIVAGLVLCPQHLSPPTVLYIYTYIYLFVCFCFVSFSDGWHTISWLFCIFVSSLSTLFFPTRVVFWGGEECTQEVSLSFSLLSEKRMMDKSVFLGH